MACEETLDSHHVASVADGVYGAAASTWAQPDMAVETRLAIGRYAGIVSAIGERPVDAAPIGTARSADGNDASCDVYEFFCRSF